MTSQARSSAIPIARGSHKAPLTPPRSVGLPPTPSSLPRGRAGRQSGFGYGDSERVLEEPLAEQGSHGQVQRRSYDALESSGEDANGGQEGMAFGDCDMGRLASGGPELLLEGEDGMDMSSLEVPEDTSFGAPPTGSEPAAFSSNAFIERPYRARYSSREELALPPVLPHVESTERPRDTRIPSIKRLRSPSSSSGVNGATPAFESDSTPATGTTAVIRRPTNALQSRQGGFDFQRATRHTSRDSSTSRRTSLVNHDNAHTPGSDVTGNITDRSKRRRGDEGIPSQSDAGIVSSPRLDQAASIDPSLIHIDNRNEVMIVDSGRRRRLSLAALPLIPLIRRASRALVSDTATSMPSRAAATSLSADRLLASYTAPQSRPSLLSNSTHNTPTSRRSVPSLPSFSSFRRATSTSFQVSPAVNFGSSNYHPPSVAPPPIPPPYNPAGDPSREQALDPLAVFWPEEVEHATQEEESSRRARLVLDRATRSLEAAESTLRESRRLTGLLEGDRGEPEVPRTQGDDTSDAALARAAEFLHTTRAANYETEDWDFEESGEEEIDSEWRLPSTQHLLDPEDSNNVRPTVGVRIGQGWPNTRSVPRPSSLPPDSATNSTPQLPPLYQMGGELSSEERTRAAENVRARVQRRPQLARNATGVTPPELSPAFLTPTNLGIDPFSQWDEAAEIAEAARFNESLLATREINARAEAWISTVPTRPSWDFARPVASSRVDHVAAGAEPRFWGEVTTLNVNSAPSLDDIPRSTSYLAERRMRGPTQRANELRRNAGTSTDPTSSLYPSVDHWRSGIPATPVWTREDRNPTLDESALTRTPSFPSTRSTSPSPRRVLPNSSGENSADRLRASLAALTASRTPARPSSLFTPVTPSESTAATAGSDVSEAGTIVERPLPVLRLPNAVSRMPGRRSTNVLDSEEVEESGDNAARYSRAREARMRGMNNYLANSQSIPQMSSSDPPYAHSVESFRRMGASVLDNSSPQPLQPNSSNRGTLADALARFGTRAHPGSRTSREETAHVQTQAHSSEATPPDERTQNIFQARSEQLASLRADRSAMRSLLDRTGDQGDPSAMTEPSRGVTNGRRALSDLMRGMRSGLAGTGRIAGFRDADFGDFFGRDSAALDPRNYLDDDDFDSSYESLIRLSERLGDVKPKGVSASKIAELTSFQYKDWPFPQRRRGACVESERCVASTSAITLPPSDEDPPLFARKGMEKEERCAVCLCDYEEDDNCLLGHCGHGFHFDCLSSWLKEHGDCPICRTRVM